MLVGPGDPIFGPGRMGGGVGGPPGHAPGMGGLPPGARWDPIAPPGMRGFHPGERKGHWWLLLVGLCVSTGHGWQFACTLRLPHGRQACLRPCGSGGCCCCVHGLCATLWLTWLLGCVPPCAADDYQQPPGRVHPDMAQPGPGRGTDFDEMFG